MHRYLFNGIRFHFRLALGEFPVVRILYAYSQCQQREACDRQTDGQTPRLISFAPLYGGRGHNNAA